MKNTTIIALIGILVIGGALFLFTGTSASQNSNTVIGNGDVQRITLSEKNSNYFPQTITVKAGSPVELTLDSSVTGCFRSFTVRSLGVAQYARTPAEKITFMPTKKGTYPFSCSMGMGTGTLVVA